MGLNVWFLFFRGEKPHPRPVPAPVEKVITVPEAVVPETPASSVPAEAKSAAAGGEMKKGATPEWNIDFSDTAFADNSWKLTPPDSAVKLEKPFTWDQANPAAPQPSGDASQAAAPPANPSPAPPSSPTPP